MLYTLLHGEFDMKGDVYGNRQICDFMNSCPFIVNLKDYKTKEVCEVFYCIDKERAMYVSGILCDDGENPEDIEIIERGI